MQQKTGQHFTIAKRATLKRLLMLALLASMAYGCTIIKDVMELPDEAVNKILIYTRGGEPVDPVEVQTKIVHFADQYLDTMYAITGRMLKEKLNPVDQLRLLRRREFVANDVIGVATGSNIFANLLDMVVLVSLNRMNLEQSNLPDHFDTMASPLLTASEEAEQEILRIAATVLKKSQLDELHNGIKVWHQQHPGWKSSIDVGSTAFAADLAKLNQSEPGNTSSVFDLLMIDPLSGLDPATRELAQTRLFAERALFLARHLPILIRGQAELMTLQTAEMPQFEKLLDSTGQLAQAAERFSQVSERLPTLISDERGHLVAALNQQRPGLISLAAQSENALTAGKLMSAATTQTLKTFQNVMKQLDEHPSKSDDKPFKIGDYTEAATQIKASAQQLVKLLEAFDQTIGPNNMNAFTASRAATNQQLQASGKAFLDYAFNKLLLLVAFSCLMVLASCLVYWRLKKKFA